MLPCTPATAPLLRAHLDLCLTLLKSLEWLLDAYVVDFFVLDHWAKLPAGWRETLQDMTPEDMARWLDPEQSPPTPRSGAPYPLALAALRVLLKKASLPRLPPPSCRDLKSHFGVSSDQDYTDGEWRSFEGEFNADGSQHRSLGHVFRKHVKPKKQHEIARVAELARAASEASGGVTRVVDVGSGVGHLSRLLSHRHFFDVVCMDTQSELTKAAKRFDEDLAKFTHKWNSQVGEPPQHLTYRLETTTEARDLDEKLADKFSISKEDLRYGIVGLHSCGDLSASLVRLFASSERAAFLLSAGCCYMMLKEAYPLSQYLQGKDCNFGYVARELSCHAIEVYRQRLLEGEAGKLRVHCCRALLEKLIQLKDPELKHTGLCTVKRAEEMEFSEYARRATARLGGLDWKDGDLGGEFVEESLKHWWRVAAFYSLRLSLAPVLETVILMDRALFLAEQGLDCVIAPVFDPAKSPRNLMIMAVK